jgi:salicylate hydroxylase
VLRGAWEEFRGTFGYEAYDAADDWWVDWGIMAHRLTGTNVMVVSGTSESSTSYEDDAEKPSLFSGFQTQTVVTYDS